MIDKQSFDLGFIIGMLEGEGCFYLMNKKGLICAQISNTNLELMKYCHQVLLKLDIENKLLIQRKVNQERNWKICYRIAIWKKSSINKLLEITYPFLISKKTQINKIKEKIQEIKSKISPIGLYKVKDYFRKQNNKLIHINSHYRNIEGNSSKSEQNRADNQAYKQQKPIIFSELIARRL